MCRPLCLRGRRLKQQQSSTMEMVSVETRCGGMGSSSAPRASPGSILSVLPDASMPEWKLRQLDRLRVNVPVHSAIIAATHAAAA